MLQKVGPILEGSRYHPRKVGEAMKVTPALPQQNGSVIIFVVKWIYLHQNQFIEENNSHTNLN